MSVEDKFDEEYKAGHPFVDLADSGGNTNAFSKWKGTEKHNKLSRGDGTSRCFIFVDNMRLMWKEHQEK